MSELLIRMTGYHVGRSWTTHELEDACPCPQAPCGLVLFDTIDPTPYFQKYGNNAWAGVKEYLDEVTRTAAAPVIRKYTGVLAAADVYTENTTFWVMESVRLDLGFGSQIHP